MAGFFQRLFKTGQAEAHAVIDKFEDPIKMSEQAIRDLKSDLQESMKSLAEVKAISIRMNKDVEENKRLAGDYERKAMLLLQRGQSGDLEANESERLAREALTRKETAANKSIEATQQAQAQKELVVKLQDNVNELKSKISAYDNDLITLKARTKTANATRKINERLSQIDSSGTVGLLERMKEKADEQEALAEAYGDMADASGTVDDEINQALSGAETPKVDDSLAQLKAKMGMQ